MPKKKKKKSGVPESYGQDEHGTLPRDERNELIISQIEDGAEVKDPEEEARERKFRDEIESEGSQDPF